MSCLIITTTLQPYWQYLICCLLPLCYGVARAYHQQVVKFGL
jgi:hypothetical protein